MTWGLTFRLREYLRRSLWFLPLLDTIACEPDLDRALAADRQGIGGQPERRSRL